MAESGEGEEIAPRGNDWEVVSLTASAYAAAPGSKAVEEIVGDKESTYEEDEVESSQAMFMSRHFLLPAKQSEDLLVGPELKNSQVLREQKIDELSPLQASEETSGTVDKDDAVKGLFLTEDNTEGEVLKGDEGDIEIVRDELQKTTIQHVANIVGLERSVEHFADKASADGASSSDVKTVISELTGPAAEATSDGPADVTPTKQGKDKKKAPWWKRQAASLYNHVKDANPLWSVVIAAAVMGLAVLGHRWQQRKSHVSLLNLQFNAKEEKPGKMVGPITRLKEALVSGNEGRVSVRSHLSSEI